MPVGNELKKQILLNVAVLAINIAVGFLAGVAFLLFIFRGDPILAAIPAVFGLPAIILQPWFLLFIFLPPPGGTLLSPVLTTIVTVPL